MGCMIARRLGLSSCAMLFICGIFGGFLMAGMMMTPPTPSPLPLTASQEPADLGSARSSGSGLDGTGGGGPASGGTGVSGKDKDKEDRGSLTAGSLSAPSAPLPRPSTRDELETFEPVIRAPLTHVKSGESLRQALGMMSS